MFFNSDVENSMMKYAEIDKSSPLPYYFQLKKIILEGIEKEVWAKDDKIPSEIEFCRSLGVSRTVVRKAIQDLVIEGQLQTKKGIGTFVSGPKIINKMIKNLSGFYEDMSTKGYRVDTSVTAQEKIYPNKKISNLLDQDKKNFVIRIGRVRKIDQEAIVYINTYIPFDLCPGLLDEDLSKTSLYGILEGKYNIKIHGKKRNIGAIAANETEAKLLKIKKGSPLIFLEGTSYLISGKTIEYFYSVNRADRILFGVDLIDTNYNIKKNQVNSI